MAILLQAGHAGRTSGSTGAPGEQQFNIDIVGRVSAKLRAKGYEVKTIDADPSDSEIAGDWDLFLTVHYDADVYNDSGGFTDYPEPSTDFVTNKSQLMAKQIAATFFSQTGIKSMPIRSNANTRYYYMWKRLSANTPCVIIECGVGWRKPKDYDPLHTNRELVATALTNGIIKALGDSMPDEMISVLKKDWDRLFKGSSLGDRLMNGLSFLRPHDPLYERNIADKDENQVDKMIGDVLKLRKERDSARNDRDNIVRNIATRFGITPNVDTQEKLIIALEGLIGSGSNENVEKILEEANAQLNGIETTTHINGVEVKRNYKV